MRLRSISALSLMLLLTPVRQSQRLELTPADPDEAAERWFLRQRAFPDDDIPLHARRAALEAMQRADAAAASYAWESLGPAPIQTQGSWKASTGRVTALAISPADPNLVLVGASTGGIWRTTDGGSTF